MNNDTTVNVRINGTDQTRGAIEEAKSGFSGLWKSVAGGMIASQLAFDALNKVKEGVHEVLDAAKEWQTQQQQLNAAIASTHGVAGVSKEDADKYAESIERSTPITRDATLAAENMLLTFTGIHKNVFPQTTQAVADMATRMNGGAIPSLEQMNNTAIMVGKALNDPAVGMTKLQRVGVTFTEQQKEQIKTMEASGNTLGAQKIILAELAKEFGGSAAANAQTFQGRIEMLKNSMISWGVDTLPKIEDELNKLMNWFIKVGGIKDLQIALHDIGEGAKDAWTFLGLLWQTLSGGDPTIKKGQQNFAGIARVLSEMQPVIQNVERFLSQLARTFVKFEVSYYRKEWSLLKDVFQFVKWAIDALTPSLTALWRQLVANIGPVLHEIISSVERLYKALEPALTDVIKVLAVILGAALFTAIWLIVNALRIAIETFGVVVHVVADVIGWIANLIGWFGTAVVALFRMEAAFLSFFLSLPGKVSNAVRGFGSLLYNSGRDLIQGLINGIESMAGHVFDAVKNIGDQAVKKLKGVLKIFSPSQVFKDLGMQIGAGLVQGIQGTEVNVTQASANLGTAAIVGGNTALNSVSNVNNSSVANNNNQNVHIANVQLGSAGAVSEFFKSLNQDAINTGRGLSPVQGLY